MNETPHLLILGLGYSGRAVARDAVKAGYRVTGTSRSADPTGMDGVTIVASDAVAAVFPLATHWLASAPPDQNGDPFLNRFASTMTACSPSWIGYFSTTGIYGDRDGGWVDESTPPDPASERAARRVAAETGWTEIALTTGARLDLLRLAGIYGPGRCVFDALRDGSSRRIVAPGHAFGRIHRDDIAGATLAAMRQGPPRRILNLVDDLPAESAEVIAHAAHLLGVAPPPAIPLEQALAGMSAMGRSFWADNRKVSSAATKAMLERPWMHPTFHEGLAAVLAEEKLSPRRDGQKP